jgi:ribosomal protein L29
MSKKKIDMLDVRQGILAHGEALFRLRFQKTLGSLEKVNLFKKERRDRARLLTKFRIERGLKDA